MQKLFTLDGGAVAITEGMIANICCPPPTRCRPLEIRIPDAVADAFDIEKIACGVHTLDWKTNRTLGSGIAQVLLLGEDMEPSELVTDVGSYFTLTVSCEDLPSVFRAEVWGIDIVAAIAVEAGEAWKRYAKHNPGVEGCADLEEAFRSGYCVACGRKS